MALKAANGTHGSKGAAPVHTVVLSADEACSMAFFLPVRLNRARGAKALLFEPGPRPQTPNGHGCYLPAPKLTPKTPPKDDSVNNGGEPNFGNKASRSRAHRGRRNVQVQGSN